MKDEEVITTLYNKISKENQRLHQQIISLQKTLDDFPKGKLICCHHGKYCKWYQSDGQNRTYIPKTNRSLAEQLAVKKYLSCVLEDLSHEKKALDSYLKHHRPASEKAEHLLTEIPGYVELLSPYFKPISQDLHDWMLTPYDKNPKNPEHLIHKTNCGHLVRSKSEAMIDSLLYTNRIPFRYECALCLDNAILYPDFTIRHPHTGELYYWEHFGLMDNPTYCKNVSGKLQTYISHGIIPSIHLITTYETQENPLSTDVIHKIIEHYFL